MDVTLFVRVHSQIACDGDYWATGHIIGVRMSTTVAYLMEQWEKYGGWE